MPGSSSNIERRAKKPKQRTLEYVLGKQTPVPLPFYASAAKTPSHEIKDDEESDEDDLPVRTRNRRSIRSVHWSDPQTSEAVSSPYRVSTSATVTQSSPAVRAARKRILSSDDEDEDESSNGTLGASPAPAPSSNLIVLDDDDEDEETDDDVRPTKRKRLSRRTVVSGSGSSESEDELVVSTPPAQRTARMPSSPGSGGASGSRSATRRGHKAMRQRHLELLRRRRRGEKVTELDVAASSDDGETKVALYDTDPEHVALSEFEDEEDTLEKDEEDVEVAESGHEAEKSGKRLKKKEEKKKKKKELDKELAADYDSDEGLDDYDDEDVSPLAQDDGDIEDFIDDSHADLIGEPDEDMLRREMPLQFTSQAHKPLKSHFKDAIEWLVHQRLNPGGVDRDDELYLRAWDRLDRELGGLAQSRFISSSWTPAFRSALAARPYMDSFHLRDGGSSTALDVEADMCHACGRSNHPASYRVLLTGNPYDSSTLEDLEENEDDESNDGDGSGNPESREAVDMHGHAIAPVSRAWYLGGVCHSNAETAHDLLHWRRALKDWVEEKLAADRLLTPAALKARDEMKKQRQRRALVNRVVDDWEADGTVSSLFRDFSRMLEAARNKSTSSTRFYGR